MNKFVHRRQGKSISLHFDVATTKSFLILFFRMKDRRKKRVKKRNRKIIWEIDRNYCK